MWVSLGIEPNAGGFGHGQRSHVVAAKLSVRAALQGDRHALEWVIGMLWNG